MKTISQALRVDIPNKLLKTFIAPDDFEGFFIELNLRKKKYLLSCSYNPHKNLIKNHVNTLSRGLDWYSSTYDNIVIIGDLNSEPTCLDDFLNTYGLKNLIREATCYKNPDKPSSIDLILTNHPRSFQDSRTVETGLSDFHKLTLTVLKMLVKKQKTKIITSETLDIFLIR